MLKNVDIKAFDSLFKKVFINLLRFLLRFVQKIRVTRLRATLFL